MTGETASAHDADAMQSPEEIVLCWWRETIGSRDAPSGPRAELRRSRTLEEVVLAPLFHDLRRRLSGTSWRSVDRLALVAGALAHGRVSDGSKTFASQMTAPREGTSSQPCVAPARFRRLLRFGDELDDLEHLFQQVRRAMALLDHKANIVDLARSLYWWNAETRKRWALDYYAHVDEREVKSE